MNFFLDAPRRAKLACVAVLALSAQMALAEVEITGPADENGPPEVDFASGISNVACYFESVPGTYHWEWGLNTDNSYYTMDGKWFDTPISKVSKYESEAKDYEISASCLNAQTYHKITDNFVAAFAAVSKFGKNYPIITGYEQMFPKW